MSTKKLVKIVAQNDRFEADFQTTIVEIISQNSSIISATIASLGISCLAISGFAATQLGPLDRRIMSTSLIIPITL
jgi:hypothetical protein